MDPSRRVTTDLPRSIVLQFIYVSGISIVQYYQYIIRYFRLTDPSNFVDSLTVILGYGLMFLKLRNLRMHRR